MGFINEKNISELNERARTTLEKLDNDVELIIDSIPSTAYMEILDSDEDTRNAFAGAMRYVNDFMALIQINTKQLIEIRKENENLRKEIERLKEKE